MKPGATNEDQRYLEETSDKLTHRYLEEVSDN